MSTATARPPAFPLAAPVGSPVPPKPAVPQAQQPAQAQAPVQAQAVSVVLPTFKIASVTQDPKNLVIYSKPKAGKTSLFAELENCLILDLENGSDYVNALKIKADSVARIKEIGTQIIAQGRPYAFIAIDTATALEDICSPYAVTLYKMTPIGKNYTGTDVRTLPNGAGWGYYREAFDNVINYIKTWAPNIIISGHVRDTMLEKAGVEVITSDLDLTGKIKRTTASNSDAIGYLYRKGAQTIISFKSSDEVSCGARPGHLRGKEIVVSEEIDGEVKTYWDRIYPSLAKK